MKVLLNNDQLKAVYHENNKNALVIAGPGSGKTRVIISRIEYLLDKPEVESSNLLIVTYTNKAIDEIYKRIQKKNLSFSKTHAGTLHSISLNFLRKKYKKEFKDLYKKIFKKSFNSFSIVESFELSNFLSKNNDFFIKKEMSFELEEFISKSKYLTYCQIISNEIEEKDIFKKWKFAKIKNTRINQQEWKKIFKNYQLHLQKEKKMEFIDILFWMYLLLNENKKVLEEIQEQFKYILIDEFQDINMIQFEIIKKICGNKNNIFAVGDPNQSIFKFQGAVPDIFNNFLSSFKKEEVVTHYLTTNYRSSKNIVELSKLSISKNAQNNWEKEYIKNITTNNDVGPKIDLCYCKDMDDIYQFIVSEIKKTDFDFSDISVLYRNNFQSKTLKDVFNYYGISFIDYKFAKYINEDDIHFLILLLNHSLNTNATTCKLIFDLLRKKELIDKRLYSQIYKLFDEKKQDFLWIFDNFEEIEKQKKISCEIIKTIASLKNKYVKDNQKMTIHWPYFLKINKQNFLDHFYKYEEIQEIIEVFLGTISYSTNKVEFQSIFINAKTFSDLLNIFCNYVYHNSNFSPKNCISLSTVHAAKGGEWKKVFLFDLTMGDIPHKFAINSKNKKDLQEERRIFYVAITRAKEQLFLLRKLSKLENSCKEVDGEETSIFISEIKKNIHKYVDEYKIFYENNQIKKINFQ